MTRAIGVPGFRSRPERAGGLLVRACLAIGLLFALVAMAPAQTYPALSGRIVDEAGIIPAPVAASIETKLTDLETKSGIQLVVATVRSLGGQDIEPYANELFRKWQLGEKTKNNGVLLIVAPNDRRVRIEVGYGLEGTLTDATSKIIIANAIAPKFKANDFGGGIERGVDDIITVLTTDASEWQKRPSLRQDQGSDAQPVSDTTIALLLFGFIALMLFCRTCREIFFQLLLSLAISGGRGGGSGGSWSSGSSGGGGFSGGGGSSGGGGASGSW